MTSASTGAAMSHLRLRFYGGVPDGTAAHGWQVRDRGQHWHRPTTAGEVAAVLAAQRVHGDRPQSLACSLPGGFLWP